MDPRQELADLIGYIHSRGWSEGTGGNYSAVLQDDPLRLLITPSGVDKGSVRPEALLVVDEDARVVEGEGRPSAETLLHFPIVRRRGARVVLHSHSVWQTLASLSPGTAFEISGLEMQKGLRDVASHEHTESVPILENSQDIPALAVELDECLVSQPLCHAVLLRGHGLYTWGCDIFEAKRHLEILEFLFEVTLRARELGV